MSDDTDGLTDRITDYIKFCTDVNIPSTEIHCYPNKKQQPKRHCVIRREKAFRMGDRIRAKEIQRELKVKIKEGKQAYGHRAAEPC